MQIFSIKTFKAINNKTCMQAGLHLLAVVLLAGGVKRRMHA